MQQHTYKHPFPIASNVMPQQFFKIIPINQYTPYYNNHQHTIINPNLQKTEGAPSMPLTYNTTSPQQKIIHPINPPTIISNTPILYDSGIHQKRYPTSYAVNHIQENLFHIYYHGTKLSLDQLLLGQDKIIWDRALTNELGRTAQGIDHIVGNDTIEFITREEVPLGRKVTYVNFVCDFRPLKLEKYRVRMTVGGDKLDYPFDSTSHAASLLETKILINFVISDAAYGARFLTLDIKDFPLQSVMETPEYMRIHKKYFTKSINEKYDIDTKIADDNYVYCKIKRGMYGLKQAARLAYDLLKKRLLPFGYYPDKICPNIWKTLKILQHLFYV